MNKFASTLRFKIMLAPAICVVLMAVIGLTGIRGLVRLTTGMSAIYRRSAVPVGNLFAVQAARLCHVKLLMAQRHGLRTNASCEKQTRIAGRAL